ncbi:Phosphatidylserine/phosphatidylglycerophosphate/cardiolipin synthase [Tenacibaculum sp. MAR_2009_124]|uniref:phospholipase D-like domain-containing protein n=1 Tax=Tenacibaculum sp. MAR_2009_124 TaxID=1250059 RepID=UPI0008972813|nr:phospholipase D-like domain-containing protein [Tenacibaculum sp. MAR_2009_124]SED18834.1 Phosphatidylserine/phosphatidylglycerophosphate/cardiolipin synthase [Tenacibaculum sp. MAR_2009_124]
MRVRDHKNGVSLHVIAGTHVVLLCLDANAESREKLLGFKLNRKEITTGETTPLKGFKQFKNNGKKEDLNLIQAFFWADYTALPNTQYEYSATPVYGSPEKQEKGEEIAINITTENPEKGSHGVFFNRGTVGQAYAKKFNNQNPDKVPNNEAYKWLSRGLEEALLSFIAKAKGKDYGLRVAAYEFDYVPVLKALFDSSESGADIQILYDRSKRGPWENTDKAVAQVPGIEKLMIPRSANSSIKHNKYIILLYKNKPIEVWTGSTNFTKGGIFGQSNVGHIVRDVEIAQQYLKYWEHLSKNPDLKEIRPLNDQLSPTPNGSLKEGITPIFSPRKDLSALDWYGQQIKKAQDSVGFTAAFGVNEEFAEIMSKEDDSLRYILLEHKGKTFDTFKSTPNNRIAIGATLNEDEIKKEGLKNWEEEHLTGLNDHVKYLHTKYLFIDPLTDTPILITGSANFSNASTHSNDENMIIVKGNTGVVDVYLSEFMRLFNHYEFRDQMAHHGYDEKYFSDYLTPNSSWSDVHYKEGTQHSKQRELFR